MRDFSEFAPVPRRDFLRIVGGAAAGLFSLAAFRSAAALEQPPKKAGATAGGATAPGATAASAAAAKAASAARGIVIYKDPNCGCCKEWVKHVRGAGFIPTVHDTADMQPVKASMGVPSDLESCHTARVGGYTIEGHVPADVIEKLLREKPVALGLAVPGMPMGSPGMDGPRKDKYDVMLFEKSGKSRVYASR
jgi:hypothetical protein